MERRLFVEGLEPRDVAERLAAYQALREKGPDPLPLKVAARGRWVLVDIPASLHVWHFHNLALWVQGTEGQPAPSATLVCSTHPDDPRWSYVLHANETTTLEGHQADGTPLRIDAPAGVVTRGEPVTPAFLPRTTLFLSKGLPTDADTAPVGQGFTVTVALPDMGADHNPDLAEGTAPAPSAPPPPKPGLWQRWFGRKA